MRLDDGAVHTRRKSEVIRIDDEPAQAASLAGREKAAYTTIVELEARSGPGDV